jgi:hypothetical protein
MPITPRQDVDGFTPCWAATSSPARPQADSSADAKTETFMLQAVDTFLWFATAFVVVSAYLNVLDLLS